MKTGKKLIKADKKKYINNIKIILDENTHLAVKQKHIIQQVYIHPSLKLTLLGISRLALAAQICMTTGMLPSLQAM